MMLQSLHSEEVASGDLWNAVLLLVTSDLYQCEMERPPVIMCNLEWIFPSAVSPTAQIQRPMCCCCAIVPSRNEGIGCRLQLIDFSGNIKFVDFIVVKQKSWRLLNLSTHISVTVKKHCYTIQLLLFPIVMAQMLNTPPRTIHHACWKSTICCCNWICNQ